MPLKKSYEKYKDLLSDKEQRELDRLLQVHGKWPLDLEEMWLLMDLVWDEIGCNNRKLDSEKVSSYYRHPVWLLNGLFLESHDVSMFHRQVISDWITEQGIKKLLDYGGGFCTLSRLVAEKNSDITIDILEPFPAAVAQKIITEFSQIHFVDHLEKKYDCIVALDVLEHVPNPLEVLSTMIHATELGGNLLIGNCFQPVIKCHLPLTFHLHSSFQNIASKMSLEFQGRIPGCHAEIYKKNSEESINWLQVRVLEAFFKWRHTRGNLVNGLKKKILR